MSFNLKILALAVVAAGSTVAVAPQSVIAQGNSGKAEARAQKSDKDKKSDKRHAAKAGHKADDRDALSQREIERRAREARERVIRDQQRRERERDDRGRVDARTASKNGKGPSFCRSGAGHPVFGRSWCVDKGFGLGADRWSRAGGWEDVVLGRDGRRSGTVSGGTLSDILGRVVYGRLQTQSSRLGGGALSGRWLSSNDGPLVLQVQSGARPLAEFVDRNRDGRADAVFLNLGR